MVTTNPVNLTLEIIDVNEPPVFTEKIYYVSTNEGPVSIHHVYLCNLRLIWTEILSKWNIDFKLSVKLRKLTSEILQKGLVFYFQVSNLQTDFLLLASTT